MSVSLLLCGYILVRDGYEFPIDIATGPSEASMDLLEDENEEASESEGMMIKRHSPSKDPEFTPTA